MMRWLAACMLVVAACADSPDRSRFRTCAPKPGFELTLALVAEGLDRPMRVRGPTPQATATDPVVDDRLFVVLADGKVMVLVDGVVQSRPYLDLGGVIRNRTFAPNAGILDLAFHPNFAENGRSFVSLINDSNEFVVAEFQGDPQKNEVDGKATILLQVPLRRQQETSPVSNLGGALAFDSFGLLFVAIGDGGGRNDEFATAQDVFSPFGKVLRIDVDMGKPYSNPVDNPFYAGGGLREIFHVGLRSPWMRNGPTNLTIVDRGQFLLDEVHQFDVGQLPTNFGWPLFDGFACLVDDATCQRVFTTSPTATLSRMPGDCGALGGEVYLGTCIPDAIGSYLYADRCSGRIVQYAGRGEIGGRDLTDSLDPGRDLVGKIGGFGSDGRGEVYVTVPEQGTIFRIEVR